uniref:Uncharacterized protein n=1 Tax=Meloidogyne enterolobii TaxID=390850 RepID=A0A6V7X4Z3_MELEN|nr:unnamed protein product [Meloidogyne enterolobii]
MFHIYYRFIFSLRFFSNIFAFSCITTIPNIIIFHWIATKHKNLKFARNNFYYNMDPN